MLHDFVMNTRTNDFFLASIMHWFYIYYSYWVGTWSAKISGMFINIFNKGGRKYIISSFNSSCLFRNSLSTFFNLKTNCGQIKSH